MGRALFLIGYLGVIVAATVIEAAASAGKRRFSRFDEVIRFVQQTRVGRAVVFVVWFWLGFHFLAR